MRITEWQTQDPQELRRQLKVQEQTIEKLRRELAEEKKRTDALLGCGVPVTAQTVEIPFVRGLEQAGETVLANLVKTTLEARL